MENISLDPNDPYYIEKLAAKADEGDAEAQCTLGLLYYEGNKHGVRQNYRGARECWEKAAERGYAEAQFNLGWIYHHGKEVKQSYVKAKEWYEKAAMQGHAESQYMLGALHYSNQGTPKSKVQAHVWFNIASANGHKEAKVILEDVTKELTANGVETAEAKATEMVEANPQLIKSQIN